jgi:short subunit dehydrogenase-like uncharacterized protein
MTSPLVIYGSYGYTGQLIAELAAERGLRPLLAGRSEQALREQSEALGGLPYLAFELSDREALDACLREAEAVLHIAGPYRFTAEPMLEACLRTHTHYLDITGELEVFEWLAQQDARARDAGIGIYPGVGFDVVPTDCMAAYLRRQLPDATHLELGFRGAGSISRGTARTMAANIGRGGMVRDRGRLLPVSLGRYTRQLPLGKRSYLSVSIPWGDVATAYYSTGIENIRVYMATTPGVAAMMKILNYSRRLLDGPLAQRLMRKAVDAYVTGPSEEVRERAKSHIWGEVRNAKGERRQAVLSTMESYRLTAHAAVSAAQRVMHGDTRAGFHTPSMAFGADFVMDFEGSQRRDLRPEEYAP